MRLLRHTILCAAGLLALGGAAGCARFGGPEEVPPTAEVTPTAAAAEVDLGTVIIPAEKPIPSVPPTALIVTPVATSTVSVTLQTVSFDPALDVVPGPWAPDGSALVAYVVMGTDGAGMAGPTGHLWTVDAGSAQPSWDSGDIEDTFQLGGLAEWQPDGTLVLARADGMKVNADGSPAADVSGIDGQVTRVDVAPEGPIIFADGVGEAWLIGADNMARKVQNEAGANIVDWTWRADGQLLAISDCGGELSVLDPATATTRKIADVPSGDHGGCTPAPRWLTSDVLVAGEPDTFINIDTAEVKSLDAWLGTGTTSDSEVSRLNSVSPDERYVVIDRYGSPAPDASYPGPSGGPRSPVLRATTLHDRTTGTSRPMEPVSSSRAWSPTSDRFAVTVPDGDLVVYSVTEDVKRVIVDRTLRAESFDWSPDGRWILFRDVEEGLWLVAGDGSTVPTRVADRIGYPWAPATWSPTGDRFAVALPNADAVRDVEATSAAAPADATAMPHGFVLAPANLVLVTIEGAGGPEEP